MPKVRFKANAALNYWVHQKASKAQVKHGDGLTWKILPPVILRSGDTVEMDDFEAEWSLAAYPDNFSIIEKPKPKLKDED